MVACNLQLARNDLYTCKILTCRYLQLAPVCWWIQMWLADSSSEQSHPLPPTAELTSPSVRLLPWMTSACLFSKHCGLCLFLKYASIYHGCAFWDMNYFLVLGFGQVTPDGRTDRRTESDAYEPTVHKHRCAQKSRGPRH